jgi:hypothetical protein
VNPPTQVKLEEAAWGAEEELDIDDEIMGETNANTLHNANDGDQNSDIYVPPSPGADPLLAVLR